MGAQEIALQPLRQGSIHDRVALQLAERGWSITDDFLPPLLVSQLAGELQDLWSTNRFRHAGVGRGDGFRLDPGIRLDQVSWLNPDCTTGAQSIYLYALNELRQAINRTLFLGLFDFEGHFAVYPPGGYYKKHLDQFDGIGDRMLTCILYLNRDWQDDDGGQLLIYTDPENENHYEEVLPSGGRLVTFLSARFLHEVLPASRDRLSITGWFKRRHRLLP